MSRILIFLSLILFLTLESCNDYSDVIIPAYLYIGDVQMTAKPEQGSTSHGYRDVWVYINDTFAGAYEIPILIPITKLGDKNVKIFAGIRNNGTLSTPVRYPMAQPFEVNIKFESQKTDTLLPIFRYYDNVKVPFNEIFDKIHFFNQELDNDFATKVVLSNSADAFEGSNSGEIQLTKTNPFLAASYDIAKAIPITPNRVFIELNYRSDITFYVGLFGFKTGEQPKDYVLGTVKPRASWGKIYFEFTKQISECTCENYRLGVIAAYDSTLAKENQFIYMDNYKLLHQ